MPGRLRMSWANYQAGFGTGNRNSSRYLEQRKTILRIKQGLAELLEGLEAQKSAGYLNYGFPGTTAGAVSQK